MLVEAWSSISFSLPIRSGCGRSAFVEDVKTYKSLVSILGTADLSKAIGTLLDWVAGVTRTKVASLFLLSTQSATFIGYDGTGKTESVRELNPQFDPQRHIISKRDEHSTIAFIETNSPIAEIDQDVRQLIIATLEEIYRRVYIRDFLRHISRPVDFTNSAAYFQETARLLF